MGDVLAVLLLILKILGITLLSVLGLILLILLLVLFWPVKYKARADYSDSSCDIYAVGSWMSIVRVIFTKKEDMALSIKFLFWELYGPKKDLRDRKKAERQKKKEEKKKEEKKKKSADKKSNKNTNDKENNLSNNKDSTLITQSTKADEECKENKSSEQSKKEIHEVSDNNKTGFNSDMDDDLSKSEDLDINKNSSADKESVKEDDSSGNSTVKENTEKKQNKEKSKKNSQSNSFYAKIKRKLEIIQTDEFKLCFEKVSKKLILLLKILLPKKWNIDAVVGFDDPATTGKVLAVSGIMYGLFPGHVRVSGDFENEIIEVHGKVFGRITIIKIIIILCELYFDKKLRKMYKKLKEA